MTNYPPSSLFWSWGAFVFLSVNFFTGILLAENNGVALIVLGSIIAFLLLSLAIFPVIYISTQENRNYSQSIEFYIPNKVIRTVLILFVPVINIGWFAIQVTIVLSLLSTMLPIIDTYAYIVAVSLSILFALGSYAFGYRWLRYFGGFSMLLLIALFVTNVFIHDWSIGGMALEPFSGDLFFIVQLIFGTWIFSSVTCLMDIARHIRYPKLAFLYVIAALFVADILVILLGTISASILGIGSMKEFLSVSSGFIAALAVILNIWSTNDSNFYSTMKALETLKIDKRTAFIIVCLLSGIIAGYGKDDLFSLIGNWLVLMSWLGVPLAVFWWFQFLKSQKAIKS